MPLTNPDKGPVSYVRIPYNKLSHYAANAVEHVVPLYTFAINDGPQEPGTMLHDLTAARHEARRLLASRASAVDVLSGECKSWSCIIREEGSEVLRIILATLVEDLRDHGVDRLIFTPR